MRSKVARRWDGTDRGRIVAICDGTAPGTLLMTTRGGATGTCSPPLSARRRSVQLRYAKPARGLVLVDAGRRGCLRERGSSLLPVRIVSVEGRFAAGDAIEVVSDGTLVGKEDQQLLGRGAGPGQGMKSG